MPCAGVQAVSGYKTGDFVGICGFSSLDWVTADFADLYSGMLSDCASSLNLFHVPWRMHLQTCKLADNQSGEPSSHQACAD